MKRVFAFVLALALVFSLSVTAFATENATTGSITITNATKNQDYKIYKIFDATLGRDTAGNVESVSYTIDPAGDLFKYMFTYDTETKTYNNEFFSYNPDNRGVTRKATATNVTAVIDYLKAAVAGSGITHTAIVPKENVTSEEVVFDNLPFGYYLITSGLGTAVTIDSNTPTAEVIDKNQKPFQDFTKQIKIGEDAEGNPIWGSKNSAYIGDVNTYQISYTATNYDGDKPIYYHSVFDTTGAAIWADFSTVEVSYSNTYDENGNPTNYQPLERGYYLHQGGVNQGLTTLGDWGTVEKEYDNAEWYLVHMDENNFRITIPWLTNHYINYSAGSATPYTLSFLDGAEHKYTSPVHVKITYKAAVMANAAIGGADQPENSNSAHAIWFNDIDRGSSHTVLTHTDVFGIGVLKDDYDTKQNLQGAEFTLYTDEACQNPVKVIPTNVDGGYMVDSLDSAADRENILNFDNNVNNPRIKFSYSGAAQTTVVSQVNGKLMILGLEAGTYYLKETKAPEGYNALNTAEVLVVNGNNDADFTVYANSEGKVANITDVDNVNFPGYAAHSHELVSTTIHNSKGVELPSTGGKGTMLMITFGTMVAMAFGVLLITHKKMSIYKDF